MQVLIGPERCVRVCLGFRARPQAGLKLASAYGGSMWSTIRLTPSGGGLVTPLPVGGATGRFVGAYRRSSSCSW